MQLSVRYHASTGSQSITSNSWSVNAHDTDGVPLSADARYDAVLLTAAIEVPWFSRDRIAPPDGDAGNDLVHAGNGNDRVFADGGNGSDQLYGGDGNRAPRATDHLGTWKQPSTRGARA